MIDYERCECGSRITLEDYFSGRECPACAGYAELTHVRGCEPSRFGVTVCDGAQKSIGCFCFITDPARDHFAASRRGDWVRLDGRCAIAPSCLPAVAVSELRGHQDVAAELRTVFRFCL